MKQNINKSFILFLLIALCYAAGNFIWWNINTPIIPNNVITITHYFDIFMNNIYLYYNAPLITYIMKAVFYLFGLEYQDLLVIIVNYVFFLIPLYFVYKIGKELKDKETGNIAMVLFALVPAVYGLSRQYGHKDYHIIAAITFNVYCLIKSGSFSDRKWSLVYGISIGLGLLVKDSFIGYFLPLYVYNVIRAIVYGVNCKKIINICLAGMLGAGISGIHYFRTEIIKKVFLDYRSETVPIFEFENFRVMTIGLWEELLSPVIFILFVIGLIFFIKKYKGENKNIILIWLVVPWLSIMLMGHYKLAEYGAGFIPAIALISAIWIAGIKKKCVKKILLGVIITISLLQYADFSYNINTGLFNWKVVVNKHIIRYYNKFNQNIMSYNNKETGISVNFVKYLKQKYPGVTFYIWDYFYYPIDRLELRLQMHLHGVKYLYNQMSDEYNVSALSDIIIYIGGLKNYKEIYDIYQKRLDRYEVLDEEKEAKIFAELKKTQKTIDENFMMLDSFYLNDIMLKDYEVVLLAKRANNKRVLL